MTSKLALRSPFFNSASIRDLNGTLNCSNIRRVQPSSMLPPP